MHPYSLTIPEEHAGKTLAELIASLQNTDDFKSRLGLFEKTMVIVSLDDKIIVYPAFSKTLVRAGQTLYIFPLVSGG